MEFISKLYCIHFNNCKIVKLQLELNHINIKEILGVLTILKLMEIIKGVF